jgi:rod shape-determining protein MreD
MQPSVPRLLRRETAQLRPAAMVTVVVLALALQMVLPRIFPPLGRIDLPLLAVVYLATDQRSVMSGLLIGAGTGLAQDALSHLPIGLFGIIKTIIGYLAGSVSLVIEVAYPGARGILVALFFLAHQGMLLVIQRMLLDSSGDFQPYGSLMLAAAHAGVALLIFQILDRFRQSR